MTTELDKVIMWLEERRTEYLRRGDYEDKIVASELTNAIEGLRNLMHLA